MFSEFIKKTKVKIKVRIDGHKKKGFTLLETLVAIFLLTLALTGPVYIATLAIRGSVESRDNISAYHLAEEVIEVIRNKRDNRSLNIINLGTDEWLKDAGGTDSLTGEVDCFNASGQNTNVCTMSRGNDGVYSFASCIAGACDPLSFNPTLGESAIIYGNTNRGETQSKFTREFYLESAMQDLNKTTNNPTSEVNVVVTIKWTDKGKDKQFKLIEHLHNQQYGEYEN